MKRVEALVRPELLIWAREGAGHSQEEAAKKAQVSVDRLASWEDGASRPSIPQLRKLSRIYKRPLAVFYLSEPPKDFQAMHDFRRLPGEVAGHESPELRLEIRKARYRRQIALDLLSSLDEEVPRFDLISTLHEDPEQLAERARLALGVTYETQSSWKSPHQALNEWKGALERLGILVFQARGVDVSEMRGFSLAEDLLPVIVVNIKDHPHARCFSLLHELAHLMLRREGLCDLVEGSPRPSEEQQVEVFCNRVAGAILLPRHLLLQEAFMQGQPAERWNDEALLHTANVYRVSREALLRRLVILDRISEAFYQRKRRQLQKEYEARDDRSESGFAPPDRVAVSAAGNTFVRLVLDSFYQEKITSSDVSDYLEVRLKWMPKIEEAVLGHRQDVLALG